MATAELVAEGCGYAEPPRQVAELYAAAPATYVEVLARLDDRFQRILLVGHNPGLEALVDELTGSPQHLPTAGLAHVEAPISAWRELALDTECDLIGVWRPKELD